MFALTEPREPMLLDDVCLTLHTTKENTSSYWKVDLFRPPLMHTVIKEGAAPRAARDMWGVLGV